MARPDYGKRWLDHYRHPRNVGSFDPGEPCVGSAVVGSPAVGEVMKLQIRMRGTVVDAACFKAFGCGAVIAAGSWTTEWLQGRSLEQIREFDSQDIIQALDLPPVKLHCALLAEDAVRAALTDYTDKHDDS